MRILTKASYKSNVLMCLVNDIESAVNLLELCKVYFMFQWQDSEHNSQDIKDYLAMLLPIDWFYHFVNFIVHRLRKIQNYHRQQLITREGSNCRTNQCSCVLRKLPVIWLLQWQYKHKRSTDKVEQWRTN
jgi:nicotinamide riboside transporter PnuC